LQLRSEAIAAAQAAGPVTLVRHRLVNTGASPVDGQLAIVVRPMQVNPPWQHGGVSPIRAVQFAGTGAGPVGNVNGRPLLMTLAFPLGDPPAGTASKALGASPPNRPDAMDDAEPGTAFDAIATRVEQQWQARFAHLGLALPDSSLVDMLRAQGAYMLINQAGPALQAGPRNYDRSFIRDGSATAAVLLRMGLASTAREYLRWYADHAVHENGLVSPILNDNGTVSRGFGSDLEYDS